MSVIITHARIRSALAATRDLGKHGVEVITADSEYSTSFFSRYSSSSFIYPSYKLNQELFINCLVNYIEKKNVNVLMPIYEETQVISKYKDRFPKNVKIPVVSYETIKNANNKRYLMSFANKIGIKIPQTWTIDDINDIKKIGKIINFPAVIKLVEGTGSNGLKYVYSQDELIEEYKKVINKFKLDSSNYPLIQEYIDGEGYGVTMLFKEGDPRAIFTHKRLREYPITGGPSTARISVRHTKMEKQAELLLKELKWHGVAMVEFKLDSRTKEPILMEINPRFWGSLNQAISSGVNFPYLLYTMAVEGDVKPVFTYKTGIKTRWILGDCRGLIDYIKTDKRREILKDFLKLYEPGLYYDEISLDDPLPGFAEVIISIKQFIKNKMNDVSIEV